jgi:catalase (peroxidase I)
MHCPSEDPASCEAAVDISTAEAIEAQEVAAARVEMLQSKAYLQDKGRDAGSTDTMLAQSKAKSIASSAGAVADTAGMRSDDRCPFHSLGTVTGCTKIGSEPNNEILSKEEYYRELKNLDIKDLYSSIVDLMTTSQACWPADGPQDGDIPSYAGLFGRLAWHCAGTLRVLAGDDASARGGCEGGRQRYWPENEWRDNSNLDKARALLGQIKNKFKKQISWGDLMTFAGTVGIKASGGPASKFCFGRVDEPDGHKSVELGVQGINQCPPGVESDSPCENNWQWHEQNETDHFQCNLSQDGRLQSSHSVGLIYVFPDGPQLKSTSLDYNPKWEHNRCPKLSAGEVRETFHTWMGQSDRETVALIGGGHTLGRMHGNCNLVDSEFDTDTPYNGEGPYFEAVPGSGRGPTDGTCGTGLQAGLGKNTITSGFEGPWTRTPSRWNHDYFPATLEEDWEPVKSPYGNDQWWTVNRTSEFASVRRLTTDLAMVADDAYRAISLDFADNPSKFDLEFANAWFKLVHRSAYHPHEDDLEKDASVCTNFEFLD